MKSPVQLRTARMKHKRVVLFFISANVLASAFLLLYPISKHAGTFISCIFYQQKSLNRFKHARLSAYPSVCLCNCLRICLSVCPYVHLSRCIMSVVNTLLIVKIQFGRNIGNYCRKIDVKTRQFQPKVTPIV